MVETELEACGNYNHIMALSGVYVFSNAVLICAAPAAWYALIKAQNHIAAPMMTL